MSLVKNPRELSQGIDLWISRVRQASMDQYRDFVWEVFKRILRETPQYSGTAVANWNLNVDGPDLNFDPDLGDPAEYDSVQGGDGRFKTRTVATRERGDEKWERYARNKARKVLATVRYGDKVFISNNSFGDDGRLYLADLQSPAYWANHLREVNKPYETVRESIIAETLKSLRRRKDPIRAGSIGGDTWKGT